MTGKVKLCVATPMYGGQCYGAFMTSIMGLDQVARDKGWDFCFVHIGNESLITRARNKLVEKFLELDCTHLLFIDADMEFNPTLLASLVDYDVDVVCGLCPKKQINWVAVKELIKTSPDTNPHLIPKRISAIDNNVNYFDGGYAVTDIPGLVPVKHAGTGCMLIKREVFTKLQTILPKFTDYGSDGLAPPKQKSLFFDTAVEEGTGAYLSEDYYFCYQWRKLGGTVYMAQHIKLHHIGTHTFY